MAELTREQIEAIREAAERGDFILLVNEFTILALCDMALRPSPVAGLVEALTDATANLAGMSSAYEKHASRHKSKGRAISDPFYSTRVKDFAAAFERARAALSRYRETVR